MTRVLVVAPTLALRAGLRALLAPTEVQVVGEASTLAAPQSIADVDAILVADEELLAGAARTMTSERAFALVVLADDDRPIAALRSLPLRGWGIVPQDASTDELASTIIAAAQGSVVLPVRIANRLIEQHPRAASLVDQPAEALTPREREVLELISQGLSNKLIARALRISEHTVKFHVSSIYTKLGASSRTEAVNRGARSGLITL